MRYPIPLVAANSPRLMGQAGVLRFAVSQGLVPQAWENVANSKPDVRRGFVGVKKASICLHWLCRV